MRTRVSVLVLALMARALLAACPRLCECKWRSGKESAVCAHAGLDALPAPLDPGTQLLDLTGNRLTAVPDDAFARAGLVNLQRVYLADCRLTALRRHAFRALINLVELDLSRNELSAIPSHAFAAVPELRELRLANNPIARLRDAAFVALPRLVRLDLSECKLAVIESRSFSGLEASLEFLKLDGNELRELRAAALAPLRSLHGIELFGNPWDCTCTLRPLREWMIRRNVPTTIAPTCSRPSRLATRSWDRLDIDDFACPPEVDAADLKTSGLEGDDVTLSCRVRGVPAPRVRWLRAGRLVANITAAAVTGARRSLVMQGDGRLSNLTIRGAETTDAGAYTCAAENRAGRAEASVTLAVARRPPGAPLAGRVLVAGVVVAILFVLGSCLVALCIYGTRRKRRVERWNEQLAVTNGREDSYEKIELSRKASEQSTAAAGAPPEQRGAYRHVPCHDTEDEAEGYNEEMETPTPTAPSRESLWRPPPPRWPAPTNIPEPDLHIPRLSNYIIDNRVDITPESAPSSSSTAAAGVLRDALDEPNRLNNNEPRCPPRARPSFHTDKLNNDLSNSDSEKNYPDLIEISSNSYVPPTTMSQYRTPEPTSKDYSFCTLPRKRIAMQHRNGTARFENFQVTDSQSPLLSESRYASSGGDSSVGSELNRRLSTDSYSHYLLYNPHNKVGQRSSSFLNLTSNTGHVRKNPSLPTSPVRETGKSATSSAAATPLLNLGELGNVDFSRCNSNKEPPAPSYDFHASQLERFLEEYRSLQDQLSKMKETRESFQSRDRLRISERRTVEGGVVAAGGSRGRPSVAVTSTSSASPLSLAQADYDLPEWTSGAALLHRLNVTSDIYQN